MRFTLFAVLALEAARFSNALKLNDQPELDSVDMQLAQINAFTENGSDNLSEALNKVISSLNPEQAAALAQIADTKTPGTSGQKKTTITDPSGGGKEKGTNISITTATD